MIRDRESVTEHDLYEGRMHWEERHDGLMRDHDRSEARWKEKYDSLYRELPQRLWFGATFSAQYRRSRAA